jgi:serine/threonine protein phosphatase 1
VEAAVEERWRRVIKRLSPNTQGRDLLIGDIHGFFTKALQALLEVGFNPAVDRVISVGDLVDRGPEPHMALEWLAQPWFHAVRGNHEQACLEDIPAYNRAMLGGGWFIGLTDAERLPYTDAFRELPYAIEIETDEGLVGVVHADPMASDWARVREILTSPDPEEGFLQGLMWSRTRIERMDWDMVEGVRAVVVGHTPVEHWTSLGNVYYIDTGAWLPADRHPGRVFTILDAATLAPAYLSRLEWPEKAEVPACP